MRNGRSIAKTDFIAAEMGGCTVWLVHPPFIVPAAANGRFLLHFPRIWDMIKL